MQDENPNLSPESEYRQRREQEELPEGAGQRERLRIDDETVRGFTALLYQVSKQAQAPVAAEQTPEFRRAVERYSRQARELATPVEGRPPCGAYHWNLPELSVAAARTLRHMHSR
jgi:hypothetical protein